MRTVQTVWASDFLSFRERFLKAFRKAYAEMAMAIHEGPGSAALTELYKENPEWAKALEPEGCESI